MVKIHNIKFAVLTLWGVQFSSIDYILIVQPLSSFSRVFYLPKLKLYILQILTPCPSLPTPTPRRAPGNHHSIPCVCERDHSWYFMYTEASRICPFVSGLSHWAECLQGSCHRMLSQVRGPSGHRARWLHRSYALTLLTAVKEAMFIQVTRITTQCFPRSEAL